MIKYITQGSALWLIYLGILTPSENQPRGFTTLNIKDVG